MRTTTLAAALVTLAIATAPAVRAQPVAPDTVDVTALRAQAATPAAKKALVASTLMLTDAEAKRFWPIYDTYQRKLDTNNRRYTRAIEDIVMAGRPFSDAYARNVAKELADTDDAQLRAQRSLASSVVKALPGRKAMRYLQLEAKLEAGYRYEVATTFPLIK